MTIDNAPQVTVTSPSRTAFIRLHRLNAAAVAGDGGFDVAAIEDLRIAVDEACAAMVDPAGDDPLEVSYQILSDELIVTGRRASSDLPSFDLHPLVDTILAATVDEHAVASGADGRSFRLAKRRGV